MKKRITALTLVLVIAFSLVGCRKNPDSTSSGSYYSEIILSEIISSDGNNIESTDSNGTNSSSNKTATNQTGSGNGSSSNTSNSSTASANSSVNNTEVSNYTLPTYASKQFEISGFWAPYEISEESFKLYKNAGLNTLAMINHTASLGYTSQGQFYLGSDRTMKALEICKKVGLSAIISYNDWLLEYKFNNKNYYSSTPFSQYDFYEQYKDIIKGVHIYDEPTKAKMQSNTISTLISDFNKVYPNADFIVNLIPTTAYSTRNFSTYEEMLEIYADNFMSKTNHPYISVDVYPFHATVKNNDMNLAENYEYIANAAKKYDAKVCFVLQSSTGNEFESSLSEGDMRWEVYTAIAYGAEELQYYCYSVPQNSDGSNMYNYCILKPDNTPSDLYYYVQSINKEIQNFASVILSYDWDETVGVWGDTSNRFQRSRISAICYNEFTNAKYYSSANGTNDFIVSHFTDNKNGEGYMFVNFADNSSNTVVATFKNCDSVAVYGGKGYSGTPKILKLDNSKLKLELEYGEGVFVVPLA